MDNLHNKLYLNLGKSFTAARKSFLKLVKLQSLVAKSGKIRKIRFQILHIFVLRLEKITMHFSREIVTFSARNTNTCESCKLQGAIFSVFYSISQPNFAVLLILGRSFKLW